MGFQYFLFSFIVVENITRAAFTDNRYLHSIISDYIHTFCQQQNAI